MLQELALAAPAALTQYSTAVSMLAVVTALLIAASSADDLYVDAFFWARELHRRLVVSKRHRPLSETDLLAKPEQPIAIMVPAWKEDDVIAAMIENANSTLDYRNYVIFVGTYPNDAATIREVEKARKRRRRVVRVDVGHAGPTCKADCLNAIIGAILEHEARTGREFAGVVLHDCEDVLHPLELKYFNYLLPRKDMIQLPVASLERRCSELVAGTYMDEFAEWHSKDLVVREILGKAVPSAGVGTCFSRRAIRTLLDQDAREPFNTSSLTEDYDIGARLREHGMSSIMARFPVSQRVKRKTWFGFGPEKEISLTMPLCVREYFPNTFRTSYRQKARWTLGIAYQGWAQLGWAETLRANYFLVRDRKAVITPALSLASYFILLNFIAYALWPQADRYGFHPIFPDEPWFFPLIVFNGVALTARIIQRLWFVNRFYGWEHALLSLPRMVVATFVNLAASIRATRIFFSNLFFGAPIVWDKTMHDFPTNDELGYEQRSLKEILVDWEALTEADAERAEAAARAAGRPFDLMLLARGLVDDDTLAEAAAVEHDLPCATLSTALVATHAHLLPINACLRLRALPIGRSAEGELELAVARPLSEAALTGFADEQGGTPVQKIVLQGALTAALLMRSCRTERLTREEVADLAELLEEGGFVARGRMRAAIAAQPVDTGAQLSRLLARVGLTMHAAPQIVANDDSRRTAA